MSKTLIGLVQAFIGESQARNRYNIYAKIATKEGYEQIAEIFNITADNERVHAKNFWRAAHTVMDKTGESMPMITVDAMAPLKVGNTADNLKAAIEGETHEHTTMYPEIADTADKEGFKAIADQVRAIAHAEVHHAERYKALLKEVEANTVFKKDKPTRWVCRECGYIHEGDEPPEQCPSCFHPRAFFEVFCEAY
ncbi:MAG: rubrerythrin family protein [Candidatus Hermodarchaeota archaeon]|nr:rubrerythrin family protein [Candidatus Hermodarchaeota archaeon]